MTLQKKWRNIKDSYNRERRRLNGAKSGSAAQRKSPYVYYNILSFLNCNTPPTNTHTSISSPDAEGTEIPQDIESPRGPYETRVLAKKRKPQDEVGRQLINVLKESAEARQKRDNEMFQDDDKLFMLSLVSDFKKVPQHLKLSVKRQFINILEETQLQANCQNTASQGYYTTQHNPQPIPPPSGYNMCYQQDYSTTQYPSREPRPTSSTPQSTAGSSDYRDDSDPGSPLFSCFDDSRQS